MNKLILSPVLAQITTMSELKNIVGYVIGLIMIFAFLYGVVLIIQGVMKRDDDPAEAKKGIIKGALIALAPSILAVIYAIVGLGGAASTAQFQ